VDVSIHAVTPVSIPAPSEAYKSVIPIKRKQGKKIILFHFIIDELKSLNQYFTTNL
jgi:hypothetical protein